MLFVLSISSLSAQNAYVTIDSIYAAIPGYNVKLESVTAAAKAYQAEITESRKLNQQKLNSLIGPYNPQTNESFDNIKLRMSEKDVLQMQLLVDEDKAISKKEESYDKIVRLEYGKSIQPDIDRVNAIIAKYVKSKKLEAVYILEQIKPALVFVNPEKVITKEIITLLEK